MDDGKVTHYLQFKQKKLLKIAESIGRDFAKQCQDASSDAAMDEVARRMSRVTQLLTPPPAGAHYEVIVRPLSKTKLLR